MHVVRLKEREKKRKHDIPTQEMTLHMDNTRWSTLKPDWLFSCSQRYGEIQYSQQKQDWELTVAQIMNSLLPIFRFKLKKVEKTTRPFSSVQFSCSVMSNSLQPHGLHAAHQASLSITNSWSLLKHMFIESVMPSNHLILCRSSAGNLRPNN